MLTLTAGASSIVVAPEHGAGLTGWMLGPTPILRRTLPQTVIANDPHAMACFPLLPYGNRIGFCCFEWLGTKYALQRNFGDNPHTIHGVAWQHAWTVDDVSRQSVTLTLNHRPGPSWPFAFDARLGYNLSDTALTVSIQMTNRHDTPAPAGIGIHPYFPQENDPQLRFNASGAWENGHDTLPLRQCQPPAEWRFASPRAVAQCRLDNCFTGWDRTADILAGPASLRIDASAEFGQLQVFTPSWADFFCVEPVSHVPNAINRHDLQIEQAMRILLPNETLRGTVRFTPTACANHPDRSNIANPASGPFRISTRRI